jgi:hypothetical protein
MLEEYLLGELSMIQAGDDSSLCLRRSSQQREKEGSISQKQKTRYF